MYIHGAAMRVAKWGNSLAVRLPNKLVEEMELRAGDEIEVVRVIQKTIEIEKSERRAAVMRETLDRRTREVRELNHMLRAWEAMRAGKDAQIAAL